MSELLPCPFCGGEAEMLTAESMNGGYLFGIMCNDCRSRGDVYDTEAEAIAAWNSRAERTCHDDNIGGSFVCSECGANVKDTYVGRSYIDKFGKRWYATSNGQAFNYCPNCGAKVVGE